MIMIKRILKTTGKAFKKYLELSGESACILYLTPTGMVPMNILKKIENEKED